MGIEDAFISGRADLSGIDGTHQLFVTDVLHKAFVKLDEKGTEAAAATAVVIAPGSAGPDPATLEAVRPFIFLIWDHSTGAILFVGRVVDPS
jgi:serpin B